MLFESVAAASWERPLLMMGEDITVKLIPTEDIFLSVTRGTMC